MGLAFARASSWSSSFEGGLEEGDGAKRKTYRAIEAFPNMVEQRDFSSSKEEVVVVVAFKEKKISRRG